MASSGWYEPARIDVEQLDWLDRTKEPVLDPELPIVDPHHHNWDARGPFAGALRSVASEGGGEVTGGAHLAEGRPGGVADPAALGWQQRYMLDDLVADTLYSGHNIIATVFVDAGTSYRRSGPIETRCVGETEFVNGIAAAGVSGIYGNCALCAGIVSTADCLLGAATFEQILQAHIAASSRFRGIRVLGYDFNTIAADPRFAEAMALLERYNLTFDVGGKTDALEDVVLLAKMYPKVTFVLNHCGGAPGPLAFADSGVEDKWRAGIAELGSTCPNVFAKVGGLQMVPNGFLGRNIDGRWSRDNRVRADPIGSEELAELTKTVYKHVIESFGPERSMWESNFPVDKVTVSYNVLWNAFKRISTELYGEGSCAEKDALFHGTAMKVYKLQLSDIEHEGKL